MTPLYVLSRRSAHTIIGLSSLSDTITYAGNTVFSRKSLGLEPALPSLGRQRAYRDSSVLGIVHLLHDSSKVVGPGEGELVARYSSFLDTVSLPDVMPSFYSAVLDSADHLWILSQTRAGNQFEWKRYNLRDSSPPQVMKRVAPGRVIDAVATPSTLVTLESDSHGGTWLVLYN